MKVITLDLLRLTIKDYGVNKLAKDIFYPRQVIQRVASGRRKPSKQLLARLGIEELVFYRRIETDEPAAASARTRSDLTEP